MIAFAYDIPQLSGEAEAAMRRAAEAALVFEGRRGDITVLLTDEAGIQALNREFRQTDRVTDVLSFPAAEGAALLAPPDGYLGDIAVCLTRAMEQAEEYGHTLHRELCFLTVHGTLHILGYDHIQAEDEAVMLQKQKQILETLGVSR